MFVPWQPFQPNLMFADKVWSLSLSGVAQALLTNIKLGWKGLPGTSTLIYLQTLVNYCRQKFYNIGPWGQSYKTFYGFS